MLGAVRWRNKSLSRIFHCDGQTWELFLPHQHRRVCFFLGGGEPVCCDLEQKQFMRPCKARVLFSVVKESLETRGALTQIKARIRAEVFSALDDQSEPRPKLSNENLLINELIREYLEFNNYKYSASVLQAGQYQNTEATRKPTMAVFDLSVRLAGGFALAMGRCGRSQLCSAGCNA